MDEGPAAIRPAGPDDAAAIAAIYAPYVIDSVASFEEAAPDGAEMAARMSQQPLRPWLVAERAGRVVGFCYAGTHRTRPAYRWSVECSVYLDAAEHRRGTGRALYGRLFSELRALGYVSVFAGITLPNPASVALHESLGFRPVGVFAAVGFKAGAWRDVGWWQLLLGNPPATPEEPLAWHPTNGR